MIHYIILAQENNFIPNTFHWQYFYKKGIGNEIPTLKKSIDNFATAKSMLIVDGFSELIPLTIEEVILQDVGEITVLFFNVDGSFERSGIYRRMVS
jgi:hypothetical protein